MSLIEDFEEFDRFVQILPPLGLGEVYFLSLSARNKYLTDEERAEFKLGRTEMYGRTLVKDKDDFYRAMEKLTGIDAYRKTKAGFLVPAKCRVVYVNINPSSMVNAYSVFTEQMDALQAEVIKALLQGKQANLDGFKNMEKHLMNAVQKSPARKFFLDIDIDADPYTRQFILESLRVDLIKFNIEHYVIATRGGFHILIKRQDLNKSKYRLHEAVKHFNSLFNEGEVIFNSNAMVPMPGTLQAGDLVRMLHA